MPVEVKTFANGDELDRFAAETVVELAVDAVRERAQCHLVLSGGGTPSPLYRLLGQAEFAHRFPWNSTHFYWGDERLVPASDPDSNYGQAMSLLLGKVPVRQANIHRIKGELAPQQAVADYQSQLLMMADSGLPWPRFDIVLLGMGADGHIASLFPGSLPLRERQKAVFAVKATYEDRPAHRVTLTPMVFNSARNILILVKGSSKAPAVAVALQGPRDEMKWPVQRLQPTTGQLLWLIDQEAARDL